MVGYKRVRGTTETICQIERSTEVVLGVATFGEHISISCVYVAIYVEAEEDGDLVK